jgi:hypothetical protein
MAVMRYESAGRWDDAVGPAILKGKDKGGKAVGLIQFSPTTARSLGTSAQALKGMDALKQLEYVEKYFRDIKSRYGVDKFDLRSLYASVLAGNPNASLETGDGYNTVGSVLRQLQKSKAVPDAEVSGALATTYKPVARKERAGLDLYREKSALKTPQQLADEAGISFDLSEAFGKDAKEVERDAAKAAWEIVRPGEPMPEGWAPDIEAALKASEPVDDDDGGMEREALRAKIGIKPGQSSGEAFRDTLAKYRAASGG